MKFYEFEINPKSTNVRIYDSDWYDQIKDDWREFPIYTLSGKLNKFPRFIFSDRNTAHGYLVREDVIALYKQYSLTGMELHEVKLKRKKLPMPEDAPKYFHVKYTNRAKMIFKYFFIAENGERTLLEASKDADGLRMRRNAIPETERKSYTIKRSSLDEADGITDFFLDGKLSGYSFVGCTERVKKLAEEHNLTELIFTELS